MGLPLDWFRLAAASDCGPPKLLAERRRNQAESGVQPHRNALSAATARTDVGGCLWDALHARTHARARAHTHTHTLVHFCAGTNKETTDVTRDRHNAGTLDTLAPGTPCQASEQSKQDKSIDRVMMSRLGAFLKVSETGI